MITMPYVNFAELSKERDNNHVEDKLPSTLYKNGDKITIKLKDGKEISGTFNGYWGEDSDYGIFIDDYAISYSEIADIIRNDIDNQINEVLKLAGVQLNDDNQIMESLNESDENTDILKNPTRNELKRYNVDKWRLLQDIDGNYYFADAFQYTHDMMSNKLRSIDISAVDANTDNCGIILYNVLTNTFYYRLLDIIDYEDVEEEYNESYLSKEFPNADLSQSYDDVEELDESVGGNYLYHGTKLDVLFQILKDNMLNGSQSDYDDRAIYGVSTSRDMNFAYNFAEMANHLDGTNEDESYQAVIVLDKNKLKQNHKIIPYNDQNAHNVYDNGERYFGIIPELLEKEEVIVGSIKNIKDYIIDIYVSPECKELNTPEKMFMFYFKQTIGNKNTKLSANDLKYHIMANSNIIRTLMNAKVYSIGRSEYNLRNNI